MVETVRQLIRSGIQTTGNMLSKLYAKLLLIAVVKRGDVDVRTPKIYVANHPNTLDPFYLLGILEERVVILITQHVFHIPVLGRLVRRAGHIAVPDRGGDVYNQAKQTLFKGMSLLIFSEGEISYSPDRLRKFHTGAVRLSLETGAPIIPIGIHLDATKIWKRKTEIKQKTLMFTWYRYGWYTVVFGNPMYVRGDVNDRSYVRKENVALRKRVMSCIDTAKHISREDALLHQRGAKHRFHSALRAAYRVACFIGFVFFKLNEFGVRVLG